MPREKPPLPKYRAQLATLVDEAPRGAAWVHEIKYDGYRIGCFVDGGEVRLESRRGQDWTASFPEIAEAAKRLPARRALLDGEVAIVLPDGTTSFQALQNVFSGATRAGLTYFVFDLLHLDGENVAELPLEARKEACQALLARVQGPSALRYSQHFDVDGPTLLERACELGAEGIISKRRDQSYRPGRSEGWLKTKCLRRQEFVIGGFTEPEGSRSGIGSLLIGYHAGDELRFAGKVGTGPGFTARYLAGVRRELDKIRTRECPFVPRPPAAVARRARWVEPRLTGEVAFTEWTEGGHVRHGSFQGFRSDKPGRDVVRDEPAAASVLQEPASVRGVAISTPERVFYPEIGLTKLDIARFYSDVADVILRYVGGRPLTLVRCDKGVTRADALRSECKFLRHAPGWHRWVKAPIRRIAIQEQKKIGEYLVIDSPEALVSLIQGDIIEIHVWNAHVDHLERPDRIVFDLDPGPEAGWEQVIAAATAVRHELSLLELESWLKLSGGSGVHVVVPFRAEHGWDEVYEFSRAVAERVVRGDPAHFTLTFSRAHRRSKILIDYKRNHRAAVAVAAYSTRARPRSSLSAPIAWDELTPVIRSDQYTVQNFRQRLERQRSDPWRAFWTARQRLEPAALASARR